MKGIVYDKTGEDGRNQVRSYHNSPRPNHLGKGAKRSDIAMLRKRDKANLIEVGNGDYDSQFSIGFEIEKQSLSRGAVTEYALFAGFETDSSCGYEAVTHILPLLAAGEWRNKVFNMFYEAERIIDDAYSPSNTNCGGHITLSVDGMSGSDLMDAVRKFSGVMYALYRHRLRNTYCSKNWVMDSSYSSSSYSSRYQVCLAKDETIEFRLPSRVQSVKQLMRRYELCYVMLDFAVNRPNASFKTFMKHVRPIVEMMYNSHGEVDNIMSLAEDFNKSIRTGVPAQGIENFVYRS